MNVFEDLIVELQQENLLESPVATQDIAQQRAFDDTEVPNSSYDESSFDADGNSDDEFVDEAEIDPNDVEAAIHETEAPAEAVPESRPSPAKLARQKADSAFFKKKAVGEVSSLQMVEHVITGVEREYLKVIPRPFDDFAAKKALNAFINSEVDVSSEEHATAEYELMHETEAWCTALAIRDRDVPVSCLRQYCERSRPALSSQALLAVGRFYRNLPYSETVRAKFDFVITRLFSRPVGQEKRVCLFTREEMLGHINTLYSDWSSIPLYDVDDDDSKVMLTALSFDDLAIEAENAGSFDQLIGNDFFGRLRMFKESIAELFYAPQVTAAAIDCNIRIGNAYVELIDRERQKLDSDSMQSKYSEHDLAISDVTGKTLELPDLLRQLGETTPAPAVKAETNTAAVEKESPTRPQKRAKSKPEVIDDPKEETSSFIQRIKANAFSVNKWLAIFAAVMIAASVGVYVWGNYAEQGDKPTSVGVKVFEVGNTTLAPHIKAARISGDIMYAQLTPSWDNLSKEKRQELLQKIYQAAQENGCSQVSLIGPNGKNAGYASATRLDVVMQ